jgi:hypothetical protein
MIRKYPAIAFVLAVLSAGTAFPKPKPVVNDTITVEQTPDKITIKGGRGRKIASDKFALSKDGWYIVKVAYTGDAVTTCQLSLITQAMLAKKESMIIGGVFTNWIGPDTTEKVLSQGLSKSEDHVIFVEDVEGPWTVEILKSPKPVPVSSDLTFSGTTGKVTPFFHLNPGAVKFTINQKLKGRFSARIEVNLINADTGAYVANLCHNATEPTQTAKVDVKVAGSYILEVIGGDTWDISYAQ